MQAELILAIAKIAILIGGLMTAAAYFVLLERWVAAWVQDRRGPNRVGIPLTKIRLFGLGQPLADGLKFIFKEEYTPSHVNRGLFVLAPISILAAALATFAVIPFGSTIPGATIRGWLGDNSGRAIELLAAPGVNVAMLYVFALSSIGVYGVILGGWASNNKYSFLGMLRSSAQLIAYELPLGLGILGVVAAAGSLEIDTIIQAQADSGVWFAIAQPLGFIVFVIAAFAEAARLPFDLPEAEQELIGGYHTEYSSMKLLLFLVAEFLHMITAAFLIVILFFGGWHIWGLTNPEFWRVDEVTWPIAILRIAVLLTKVFLVIFFFMMVRWSWPRFRFDQLMNLAWKIMLPLGMVNLTAVAVFEELRTSLNASNWILVPVAWLVCIGGWLAVAYVAPLASDNRPRREMLPPEIEAQV